MSELKKGNLQEYENGYYEGYCQECGGKIKTNIQGNERHPYHTCIKNTRNKGDLVMANGILCHYSHIVLIGKHLSERVGGRGVGDDLQYTEEEPPTATSPQVEAYLKEKGWVKDEDSYAHEANAFLFYKTKWSNWEIDIANKQLANNDTAPTQLQEAITMAKLLNATKP